MNPRTTGTFIGIIVIATFITGYLVLPALPLTVASHWDAAGEVNGTMSRIWGTFLLPVMMLILWGVWALLPRIDPIAPGFKGFRYVYDFFWVVLTTFLAYVYALSLGANLGWEVNMAYAIVPALGALFLILGALLPHIKRNWFFGIRTPWTLSDDDVWNATHRVASRLFELAGIVAIIAAFAAPKAALWIMIVLIACAAIVSVGYSYVLLRRKRRGAL